MTVPHEGFDGESTATLALQPAGATLSSCLPILPTITLPHRRALRAVRRCEPWAACCSGLFGASCLALFVGWLSLHWLILPHIEEWRGPIEARASRLLGAVVKIGAIEVRSSGWVPALELRDVQVLDAEQRVALSLPRVAASLSPRSLLALEPRFEQLLIDAPALDIRRDAAGHIRVAGLDFGGKDSGADDGGDAAALVLQAGGVRDPRRHGALDRRAAAGAAAGARPASTWWCATACARTTSASTPRRRPAWGDRFTIRGRFSQPLFARAGDWRRWSGSMFSDLPRADVRELRRYVTLPFELSEGDGALRGWFEVHEGQPEAATVDISLRAVALRLDKSVEALEFEQVEGRFDARRKGDRIAVEARGFGFVTGDGIRWPKGDLSVAWVQPEGEDVTSGEFSAERLDIGVMAGIAGRVPLGAALRALLADVHPEGVITQLSTRWDGPIDAPAHYRVKGKLSGLSLTAHAGERHDAVGRPGLRNATVQLDASEAGGEARIGLEQGVVELPGVFDEPALPFDRLDAKLAWKIEPRPGAPAERHGAGARGALRQRRCRGRAERDLAHRRRRGHGARRPLSRASSSSTAGSAAPAPRARCATCRSACPTRCAATSAGRSSTARSSGPRSGSAATSGTSRSTAASRAATASSGSRPRSTTSSFAYVPAEAGRVAPGRGRQLRPGRR